MSRRLLYLVSHPIQYQAPLLRRIAAEPDIRLRVLFERDTVAGSYDPGFGRHVRWDVPLRQGYDSVLLGETELERELANCDALWLHGWQTPAMRGAMRRAAALGIPVLMRGENTDSAMPDGRGLRGWAKRRYLAGLFRHCAAFLAIGSDNRDYYLRHGIPPERIFLVPYAVDNERFARQAAEAAPRRAELRQRLGLPAEGRIVLYAGKFTPRKHPDMLLRAWRAAPWRDTPPLLVYVGDGELGGALRQMATPQVHFLGFRNQSELPALYDLADIFVLPSEREPWGLAVNEAMACGTAVVVSDQVGCARDLVDAGCGAVFPAGDEAALAEALAEVAARADAAGQAARRRVAGWDFAADIAGLRQALEHVAP